MVGFSGKFSLSFAGTARKNENNGKQTDEQPFIHYTHWGTLGGSGSVKSLLPILLGISFMPTS